MKSKGPVDFFLGVFLEFGAAFCILFFLPQVPWHWLPAEGGSVPSAVISQSPISGAAATQRRVSLLPSRPAFTRPDFSLSLPTRREVPALLPAEVEPAAVVLPPSAPLATHQPAASPRSHYRRELPRQYRY